MLWTHCWLRFSTRHYNSQDFSQQSWEFCTSCQTAWDFCQPNHEPSISFSILTPSLIEEHCLIIGVLCEDTEHQPQYHFTECSTFSLLTNERWAVDLSPVIQPVQTTKQSSHFNHPSSGPEETLWETVSKAILKSRYKNIHHCPHPHNKSFNHLRPSGCLSNASTHVHCSLSLHVSTSCVLFFGLLVH